VAGDAALLASLPDKFREQPARSIQELPNYARPSLLSWLDRHGKNVTDPLSIGDLLDLGFDPTRLKEITIDGNRFICERMQLKQLPLLEKKRALLEQIPVVLPGMRVHNAFLKPNPPVLVLRDRGNIYVLRRKIDGIHWEEAMEQLQADSALRSLNTATRVDRVIRDTVWRALELIPTKMQVGEPLPSDFLTCFVSWDLKRNRPRMMVDPSGSYLESVWVA
jgi:hypothetical protein